jgi:hypothetical protein
MIHEEYDEVRKYAIRAFFLFDPDRPANDFTPPSIGYSEDNVFVT